MELATTTKDSSKNEISIGLSSDADFTIPPVVAKSPDDCIVGPTDDERATNRPSWHSSNNNNNNSPRKQKRKRDAAGATSFSDSSFSNAIGTFLSSGCCVIPNAVLPQEFVEGALDKATNDLNLLQKEMDILRERAIQTQDANLLAQVGRGDFRELVDRDGGRRDVRFQLDRYPFSARGLIYNPIVFPLVQELLGGGEANISLLYAGVMWARPNQNDDEPQKWHADGGHLFDHIHLPPHCINVFFPLVDISKENGFTEFVPGSHQLGSFCEQNGGDQKKFGLCCEAGGAVLFDYRLKHRGGSNTSTTSRPVLYLAYAKPFFRDMGNTRSEKSLLGHSPKSSPISSSPPWVSRILQGNAANIGQGFENEDQTTDSKQDGVNNSSTEIGSGERWVLFRMNVELPGCAAEDNKTITVYHGDIASEVSAQFCTANGLDESFVSVLAGAIQQQMDNSAGT